MVVQLKPMSRPVLQKRPPILVKQERAAQVVMQKIHHERLKPHHKMIHRRLMRPESHPLPKKPAAFGR